MLKRIILLRRKPDLSRADMLHYWQHTHAPLAMQYPEWFESTHRYTQNHIGEQVCGGPFDFDGMVESWQRPAGSVGRSFPDTQAYREVVGPDELKFVDRAASVLFFVNERVLAPREGNIKVLTFLARRAEMSAEDFSARWLDSGAAAARQARGFWSRVRGHVQNVVVPGSLRVIGDPAAPLPFQVDGMEELRFRSIEAMREAFAPDALAAREAALRTFGEPIASIVAREVTLYDRDAPVRP